MRYDWNSLLSTENKPLFTDLTDDYFPKAQLMAEYVENFANYHDINIQHSCSVENISKTDDGIFKIQVKDSETIYYAPIVINASGFGESYRPNIKGIEYAEDYATARIDGEFYKNKKVAIIGKGNSGFEFAKGIFDYAETIILISPNPLKEASQTHYVGSVRATNNISYEAYQLKSKNFLMNSEIRKIEPNKHDPNKFNIYFPFTDQEKYEEAHVVDHIINATGFKMSTSFFDESIKPQMRNCTKLPMLDHTFQSVNVPNLYFVGCLMHGCDYKRGTSGFVHGFRHNIKFLYQHILEKHFKRDFEHIQCKTLDEMCDIFLYESLYSQELFLQIKTLCDVAIIRKHEIIYYKGMLQDYAKHDDFKKEQGDIVIIMYLDYGKFFESTHNHPRPSKIEEGYTSSYLHPKYFIYKYDEEELKLMSRFEILEEIDNNFSKDARETRMRDSIRIGVSKIKSMNLKRQDKSVNIQLHEKNLDPEVIMHKIIGPYRTINLKYGKNMNFMKLLPFEHVTDALVFKHSSHNEGYTFDAKSNFDNEFWSIRIHTACTNSGIIKVELWPHKGSEVTILPIELEFTFPPDMSFPGGGCNNGKLCQNEKFEDIRKDSASGVITANLTYMTDLDQNFIILLREGLCKTEQLF